MMHVNILRNCKISSHQILFGFTLQSYYMSLGWSHLTAAVCHQVHKGNEILCIPTPSKQTTYAHMDVHGGACEMGMGEGATKRLGPISREIAAKVVMYTNCSQECEDTQDTFAIPQGTHSIYECECM